MSRSGLANRAVHVQANPSRVRIFLPLLLPLNATLHRSVSLGAPLQQHCKNRLSCKESRDESNENFAILVGVLNAAVPVRGQGNVEAIVAENVRPLLPQNGR